MFSVALLIHFLAVSQRRRTRKEKGERVAEGLKGKRRQCLYSLHMERSALLRELLGVAASRPRRPSEHTGVLFELLRERQTPRDTVPWLVLGLTPNRAGSPELVDEAALAEQVCPRFLSATILLSSAEVLQHA